MNGKTVLLAVLCLGLLATNTERHAFAQSTAQAPQAAATSVPATPDYLGQPLPGETAVKFAPGIVSKGNVHGRLAISPDGRDIFWTAFEGSAMDGKAHVMHVYRTATGWSAPQIASFAGTDMTAEPVFSPDGKKLYFSRRAGNGAPVIQRVEKTASGWSLSKNNGDSINPTASFTRTGKIYFSDVLKGKVWERGIYCARLGNAGMTGIVALDSVINSPYIDYTPHIAPDESFLMFSSSRPHKEENMSLYISFRGADGKWSEPKKMNSAIGFHKKARFPSLSPDGKLLFFCGDDGNIYWVQSSVIGKLK